MKGSIRPGRIPGTWYLRVELANGSDGRRRQRRETMRGTKAEAQRRLRDILRDAETGGYANNARITVADLAQRWLAAAEHRVGARTHGNYAAHVRYSIVPALGSLRAETLRPAHIEAALSAWITGGRADKRSDRKHLSSRTVGHIFNTLRTICRWGVRMGILVRNPAESVEPPKVERKEMRALDPSGVAELLAIIRGTEAELAIIVAIGTGLRRGELLGLRWSDVNLNTARLTVRRSVETVKGVTRTKPPKTTRSARTIAIPGFALEALRSQRTESDKRRAFLGLARTEEDWVFTRADESPWTPHVFSLTFARIVKRAGLKPAILIMGEQAYLECPDIAG